MPTHLDSIFFHWSGPSLIRLASLLRCPVSTASLRRPSPTALELLCLTLFSRPVTTSGHGEISSPKPFVWFRAKTDKGIVCLAGHLHSVTFKPFHFFTAGDQLVVPIGVTHISLPLHQIQSREQEKKKEQTNKRLGLTQVQKGSYATLHFLCTYVD